MIRLSMRQFCDKTALFHRKAVSAVLFIFYSFFKPTISEGGNYRESDTGSRSLKILKTDPIHHSRICLDVRCHHTTGRTQKAYRGGNVVCVLYRGTKSTYRARMVVVSPYSLWRPRHASRNVLLLVLDKHTFEERPQVPSNSTIVVEYTYRTVILARIPMMFIRQRRF